MSIQKLANAHLRVRNINEAIEFHEEVLGLAQIARGGDVVYYGAGLDDNYDVALIGNGDTGVAAMSFDVTGDDDLEHYGKRLKDAGVKTEIGTDTDPGVEKALSFQLPSGHKMELIILAENPHYLRVSRPKHPRNVGIAPLGADHITLHVHDGRGFVEFLRDVLDFQPSDIFEPAPGVWAAAWTHCSDQHHDLATLPPGKDGDTIHHFAWSLDGIDHMKRAADYMAHKGIEIEVGPGRHGIGSNLYTYFIAPGGNRYELSAEMGRATNKAGEPDFWNADQFAKGFSAWGHVPPESFQQGS